MFISQNLFCLDKTANRDSRSRHNGSQFVTWDKVSACNKCIRGWWYNVNCASGQNSNFNGVYLRGKEGRFHWSYLDLSHPYNSAPTTTEMKIRPVKYCGKSPKIRFLSYFHILYPNMSW